MACGDRERQTGSFQNQRHFSVEEAAKNAMWMLGYAQIKPEQMEVFVLGRDVFATLPAGYGKSLCYA